ncbi:protein DMP3 [Andrographis paniculata]|uniref:protein DMP3 n=1 Tax=Andrographis paniculata TaxID=175694 RepID=UPI0021E7E74D|nr:protein DMP3 [Andrographis paniculata]
MSLRQRPQPPPPQPSAVDPPPAPLRLPPERTALSQALESTAHLANLLPTGTLLAFQLLTPIFTNNGSCDAATRPLSFSLLLVLSLSCFLASFTDSVRVSDGRLYYGLATPKGLWLFDYNEDASLAPDDLGKYRLKFVDVVHAVLSVLVFGAVALRDKNVVSCFYPAPGDEAREVLDAVPVGIGVVCSLLFVVFPSTRHGIGYPLSK